FCCCCCCCLFVCFLKYCSSLFCFTSLYVMTPCCIFVFSGIHGPDAGWASSYPECREKNQSPINIVDQSTKVSTEFQELTLEGFDAESSNKTSMKNTGKTVAIMLKDDYFVRGAGLPGRFKAEKVEFHWGPSNGSEGSEHSINGRRYPVEVRTCCSLTCCFKHTARQHSTHPE
uniref:Alpha-carbonic anhydrase domain-containing protein n=1 Tax=Stegastes partitus TaxID=144197 RepID=A0A3B5BEC9_9TELE